MPSIQETSSPSSPITNATVHTDDHQQVTARHQSAAQTGAAAAKAVDKAADLGVATGQKAKELGSAAQQKTADAYESTKQGAQKAKDHAVATSRNIADTTKAGFDQATTKAKQAGKTVADATTAAGQRVNAEAKGILKTISDSYNRSISAGAGERPITFLGFNSVPVATAGALLGLGLGIAGLFAAVTIYVPLSWILLGAGAVSLVDLTTSLIYRSRQKALNPTAEPLTAIDDSSSAQIKSAEDRLARIQSDCDAFLDAAELQKRAIDGEMRALTSKDAKVKAEIETKEQELKDLTAKREAIIQKHNESVTEIPESIHRAVEEVDAQRKSVLEKKEQMLALGESYKANLAASAEKHSELMAHLKTVDDATRKLAENVAQAGSVHKTLTRLDQTTDTHKQGTTVKLDTASKTKDKGKSRQAAA